MAVFARRATKGLQSAFATDRDHNRATVTVFTAVVSLTLAGIYLAARIGFENPIGPVLKALTLSLFVLTFPEMARIGLAAAGIAPDSAWYCSHPALILIGLLLAALAGLASAFLPLSLFYPVFMVLGVVGMAVVLYRWLRADGLLASLLFIAGAAIIAVWAGGVILGFPLCRPAIS